MIRPPRPAARALLRLIVATALIGACPGRVVWAQSSPERLQLTVAAWWPSANIHAAGESGGIQGTPIDFGSDFHLRNHALPEIGLAVRPRARHELSLGYVPIRYNTSAILGHDVTFAGTVYPSGIQTQGIVSWNALRIGYAYDFLLKQRASFGIVAEVDRTDVQVRLQNAASMTSTSASVRTVPGLGAVARFQASPKLAVRATAAGIYVPDRKDEIYGGHYLNAEAHATWAATRYAGVDFGFRLIDIRHLGHADSGTLKLQGVTLGVIVHR